MKTLFGACLALTLSGAALAQPATNPVIEHFRAYRAAIAQGDLAAADTAAAAALAASEMRDGDGGRTAILALNLASLRLERGDRAGALAPAERAHALAVTRGDANVDVIMTRLVLARASLSTEITTKSELAAAIATSPAELSAEIYLAALDLGRCEMEDGRFVEAARAFAAASANAHNAPGEPTLARAQTLTMEAIAQIYVAADMRPLSRVRDEEIGAHTKLHEAFALIGPTLADPVSGQPPTRDQRAFATARIWHSVLDARLGTLTRPWRNETWESFSVPPDEEQANRCPVRIIPRPLPEYPRDAIYDLEVGAAMVWFHLDDQGNVVGREIAAAAPTTGQFVDAVSSVYDDWEITRRGLPVGCEMPEVIIQSVVFRLP